MKCHRRRPSIQRALTLIEMTIVIGILLVLMSGGLHFGRKVDEWKLGRAAGETLRTVHTAQRGYLADHPTTAVNSITAANLLPYMPGNYQTMPSVKSLTGQTLAIRVNVIPPVVVDPSGSVYDPSGKSRDGLWDVGE
jgi:prepilin-type N-terminal cleavage/methylation domain-containing protein